MRVITIQWVDHNGQEQVRRMRELHQARDLLDLLENLGVSNVRIKFDYFPPPNGG